MYTVMMNMVPIFLEEQVVQLGTHANSAALRTALLHWCYSSRNFGAYPTMTAGNGTGAHFTPTVVFKHRSSRLPSGKVVHHKAKQTEEFFVQNQFVRCTLPDGVWRRKLSSATPCFFFLTRTVPLWKSSGETGRLGDRWAMLGAQWNRTSSIGLRCQPWIESGGRCVLPTRRAMVVCRQACPQASSA